MIPGFDDLTYFELLDISPDSGNKEVQEAYYRVRATFNHNALASYSLYTAEERDKILRLVEEAYHTLIDDRAREDYEHKLKKEKRFLRSQKATQEYLPLTPQNLHSEEKISFSAHETANEDVEETDLERLPEYSGPETEEEGHEEKGSSGISYVEEYYQEQETESEEDQEEAEQGPYIDEELKEGLQPADETAEPEEAADSSEEKDAAAEDDAEKAEDSTAGGPVVEEASPSFTGKEEKTEEEAEEKEDYRDARPFSSRGESISIREAQAARARGEKIDIKSSIKSRVSDIPEHVFSASSQAPPEQTGETSQSMEFGKKGGEKERNYGQGGAFEDTVYNLPPTKKTSTPLDYLDTSYSGQYLKNVRETQGIDLYKAWEITKIRKPILEAIEEEDLKKLPADVFLKGMLLIYARFLGLEDPDAVVRGYMERLIAARDWMD